MDLPHLLSLDSLTQVKWIRVVYSRFEDYSRDAEWLVTRSDPDACDYVEGFAFVNSADPVDGWPSVPLSPSSPFEPALIPAGSGPVLYCLEVALHFNHDEHDTIDQVTLFKTRGHSRHCIHESEPVPGLFCGCSRCAPSAGSSDALIFPECPCSIANLRSLDRWFSGNKLKYQWHLLTAVYVMSGRCQ